MQEQQDFQCQYAKRMVEEERCMAASQPFHHVNQAGVLLLSSRSLLQFPLTITYVLQSSFTQWMSKYPFHQESRDLGLRTKYHADTVLHILSIRLSRLVSCYCTQYETEWRFVPGIRPGAATEEYLSRIMSRLFSGGIFLAAGVATIPTVVRNLHRYSCSVELHF